MKNRLSCVAIAAIALLTMTGTAAIGQAGPAAVADPAQGVATQQAPRVELPDTPGTGLFPAIKEIVPSLPDHVIYHPADLSRLGGRMLGILVWGNGACSDDGAGGS